MQVIILHDPSKLVPSNLVAITSRHSYTPFRFQPAVAASFSWGYQPRKGGFETSPLPRTRLPFPAYLQETRRLIKSARTVPYGPAPLKRVRFTENSFSTGMEVCWQDNPPEPGIPRCGRYTTQLPSIYTLRHRSSAPLEHLQPDLSGGEQLIWWVSVRPYRYV